MPLFYCPFQIPRGNGFCQPSLLQCGNRSGNVWRSGCRVQPPQRVPIPPALNRFSICLSFFFFFRFIQPKQGRWLLWQRDEISFSPRRPLGVTSSRDLGYWGPCACRPCNTHLLPAESPGGTERSERQPHDSTRRANRRRTRVRSWFVWKGIKGAARKRQGIISKEEKRKTGVTCACGKGRMLPWRSQVGESFITAPSIISAGRGREMARSQTGSLLAFFRVACVLSKIHTCRRIRWLVYTHSHTRASKKRETDN